MSQTPKMAPGTKAIMEAHGRMLSTFGKAKERLAHTPLMHQNIDPRTQAKRDHQYKQLDDFFKTGQLPEDFGGNSPYPVPSKENKPSRATTKQVLTKLPVSDPKRAAGRPMQPDQVGVGGFGSVETGYNIGDNWS